MRLHESLKSNHVSFEEVIKAVYTHAMPWLKKVIKKGQPLFAYSGRKVLSDYFIRAVRTDRRPADTTQRLHQHWDEMFEKKFGWKGRSQSIFVTGQKVHAEAYGNVYMIFPEAPFKYIWSNRVEDLYTWASRHPPESASDEMWHNWEVKNQNLLDTYTDKDIVAALKMSKGYEVMLNTKQYVAVQYDLYYDLFYTWFVHYSGNDVPNRFRIEKIESRLEAVNWEKVPLYREK